jgi:hypothetical protein
MSERKAVVWFGDDPQPDTFFFRSPFRSWMFIVNTVLLVSVCVGFVIVGWGYSNFGLLLAILICNVIIPYGRALKLHERINELHLSGKLAEPPAESPLNDLLAVAHISVNGGLFNTSVMFALYLIILFRHHL